MALVVRRAGLQHLILVRQRITASEEATGAVVHRQDPPAPIQVEDADPRILEQGGHGRVPRLGADQRLPDVDELPDMGEQCLDQGDLRRPPAIRAHGIAEAPRHMGAIQPVEAHVQALLIPTPEQCLVVGARGFQFLGRVQVGDRHQMAVEQLPRARYAFVDGMVDVEVLTLHIGVALPAVVEPDVEDPDVVGRAFADQEGIARDAAGLVNQGRGGRPVRIVKHGVVQRRQDALECVFVDHLQ